MKNEQKLFVLKS